MALIPADVGLRMRLDNELQPQQVAPIKGLPADLPRLQAGQVFTAQIRDILPQNTYLALVAGRQLTLSLPENVKSGDVLELVVIEQTPQAIVAKRADPGAQTAPPPQTTLSNTAQLLRSMLVKEGESPASAPLNRGQPLLAHPPQSGAELAPALSKAVSQSGLFYESHQAQWVAGKFPLAHLRQEPQGQQILPRTALPGQAPSSAAGAPGSPSLPTTSAPLSSPSLPTPPTSTSQAIAAFLQTTPAPQPLPPGLQLYQANLPTPENTSPQFPASPSSPQPSSPQPSHAPAASTQTSGLPSPSSPQAETPSETTLLRVYTHTASPQPAAPLPDELRALVQQQLDAAGSQRLLWHGEVWPEQSLHWQLEWQEQSGTNRPDEDALPWQTTLRLTTPRLGSLEATLQLGQAGVRISLNAAETRSAEEMRERSAELFQSLEAAGLTLLGLTVRQTPQGEP